MTLQSRAALLAQAQELINSPDYSKETNARVEALLALADAQSDRTDLRKAKLERYASEAGRPAPEWQEHTAPLQSGERHQRFEAFLRGGIRAQQGEGTGSAGGYLVPPTFTNFVWQALAAYDELFLPSVSTRFETINGSSTAAPPIIDDFNDGDPIAAVEVSENAPNSEQDIVFASVGYPTCPKWGTGYVPVSVELMQDSRFPMAEIVGKVFAKRFAHGFGAYSITKILAAAGAGVTCASETAIAPDELWDLVESLDAAYLPNASFSMSAATYVALSQLKSSTNAYIFPPTFNAAGRPTLCGKFPIYLSPSMPAMTAGLSPIVFGDLSTFMVREVRDSLETLRLVQLKALLGQVVFLGFWRLDAALQKPSSGPIPVMALTMAAS